MDSYLELMEQPCPQAEPVANTAKLAWAMSSRSSVVRASSSLLPAMVSSEVSGGTRHLAIDAAGLAFADSASIYVLLTAAKTLKERGGGLLLMRPQRTVATVLHLTGASELITIREETGAEHRP